jgi:hypothetical protein
VCYAVRHVLASVPESPQLATKERSEKRREIGAAAAAAAAAEQAGDIAEQRHYERVAARHYVEQRRAITISPTLLTKARGLIHAERFQQLVDEEEVCMLLRVAWTPIAQ